MPCQVLVIGGPARSGKTTRLLSEYRRSLEHGPIGAALWLSPHHRAASALARQLLATGIDGCLSPNIATFGRLAQRFLETTASPLRPMSRGMSRLALKRVIEQCVADDSLSYFRPIAETPGFLELMSGFIRELKRLEIWPEELAQAQGRRASARDRELGLVYQQYQDLLHTGNLYDEQGRSWAARERMRSEAWGPLSAVRCVYVDGFADFTRTELDVLELLAGRAERLLISVPRDQASERSELFARGEQTLDALHTRFPQLVVEQLPPCPLEPAAVGHLERRLFGNPRAVEPLDDIRGIELVAAAGVTHEIELIAQRIKKLLTSGDDRRPVHADEILVIFRSLGETGQLVREIFARYGIPASIAAESSLITSPLATALVNWLRLDLEDWPFRLFVSVLGSTYLRPDWPECQDGEAAAALVRLARELELPAGRAAFLTSVAWLEAKSTEHLAAKRRLSTKLAAARATAPFVRRMAAAFDRLPQQATPTEWTRALREFATELGMLRGADASSCGAERGVSDKVAWERIVALLAEAERLARWTGAPVPRWNRAELLQYLQDMCSSDALPLTDGEEGVVRVLPAESVRGLIAPYVFVCGLSEKAFPPPHRDDCLYTDADARRWGASGLPLPSNADRGRFEMLLFYEVVTRATRRLVLSYPALDAQAQALVPSPFLREVEHVCGPGRIPGKAAPHLDCIPLDDAVVSPRDFRIRAVSEGLAGRDALFGQLCAHPGTRNVARNIVAGLTMTESRDRQAVFGTYEGVFTSDTARGKLAERFGSAHCWSPSKLEEYANCPHQFFLKNVLRVRPLAEPELATDYMGRGQVLHWLLAQAHRALNDGRGGPTSPGGKALSEFNAAVESLARQLRRDSAKGTLAAGLVEINVRQVLAWLERYQQHHRDYEQRWLHWSQPPRPAHFEVAFGPQREDDEEELSDKQDPLSSTAPFELECEGEFVRFNGRIDRVDLGTCGSQQVFTVVDYKSGKPRARTKLAAVLDGNSLQLPIYALAAEKLLSECGAIPFRAAYWHFAGEGYQDDQAVKFHLDLEGRLQIADEWAELEGFLRTRIAALVRGIRSGEFPMLSSDDKCTSFCDYRTVCRVNQARSREKSWQPPEGEAS